MAVISFFGTFVASNYETYYLLIDKHMIKKHLFFAFLLLMGSAISFTSCSSSSDDDGDNGTLDPPAYKSVSALYEVTSSGSKYSTIEFTESGNYIISTVASSRVMKDFEDEEFSFTKAPWQDQLTRSTSYGNIITGKYTVDGNKYTLEGFGTITVNTSGSSTVSLEIGETGSQPYTLTAAKKNQKQDSEQTSKLCRSWKVQSIGLKASYVYDKSHTFNFDKTVNGGNLAELMTLFYTDMINWAADIYRQNGQSISQAEIDKAIESQKKRFYASIKGIDGLLFSQAGTYMVTYSDETLAIATWSWQDDTSNILQYSWNYQNMNSNVSGVCAIDFKGSKCIVTEARNDGNTTDAIVTYTLVEIK